MYIHIYIYIYIHIVYRGKQTDNSNKLYDLVKKLFVSVSCTTRFGKSGFSLSLSVCFLLRRSSSRRAA